MASRLSSEALVSAYDSGASLPQSTSSSAAEQLLSVDAERILASPAATELVRELPAQILFNTIKTQGIEASVGLIHRLSQEQLVRILDYDAWTDGALDRKKAIRWLDVYSEVAPQELAARFHSLDEEYQIALLEGLIQIYDAEEIEHLPHEKRENLYAMPCGQLFYDVLTEDEVLGSFVVKLIQSAQSYRMSYAYSLISHIAYAVPQEAAASLAQFRKARLEEDGFVGEEESAQLFMRSNPEILRGRLGNRSSCVSSRDLSVPQKFTKTYLENVVEWAVENDGWDMERGLRLEQGVAYLCNAMSVAARIEAHDAKQLGRIVEQVRAILSVGLEDLAGDDFKAALNILDSEHVRVLVQHGFSVLGELQEDILLKLSELDLPEFAKIERNWRMLRFGMVLWSIDANWQERLGGIICEAIKGFFNRFPMRFVVENPPTNTIGGSSASEKLRFSFQSLKGARDARKTQQTILTMLSHRASLS